MEPNVAPSTTPDLSPSPSLHLLFRPLTISSYLFFRYIVSCFGACLKEPNVALVMELMEGGTLADLLHSPDVELPWGVRLTMVEEIVKGIQVLHATKPQVLGYILFPLLLFIMINKKKIGPIENNDNCKCFLHYLSF
jgi:hypothetical protein